MQSCLFPELTLKDKPAVKAKEFWRHFAKQLTSIEDLKQFVRANCLRVWCTSIDVAENLKHSSLLLRGHRMCFSNLCRLVLADGLLVANIESFFFAYGVVTAIQFVKNREAFTATIKIQMVLHQDAYA